MYLYLLALLPLAAAQYASNYSSAYGPTATSAAVTPTSTANVLNVSVGNGGLIFNPNNLNASVGDKIQFTFYPKNHSVAQSSFASPCKPDTNAFFSGFMPTSSGANTEAFTLTVNDTNPIWIYCSQVNHCQSGMAMVINAPAGPNTIEAYVAAAKNSSTVSPATIQGGTLSQSTSSNSTASGTSGSTASGPSTGSATAATTSGSAADVGKSLEWATVGMALLFGGLFI